MLTPLGTMSILTIPSDNGTWATMLYASSKDKPLRRFKDPEVFDRVVRSSPQHAHWLDGTPISDMATMVGVSDRTRTFVIDGEPVVTGMLTIADAAACTNPSVGRGMSLGLIHTEVMRDTVRSHLDDPLALATEFARRTTAEVDTWHHATRALDRARVAEMQALADGIDLPADPTTGIGNVLARGAGVDLTIARAMGEIQGCLAHADEVLSRPGLFEHLLSLDLGDPQGMSTGPTRAQLLDLVS